MLSVAPVSSSDGAASYYAADNYYTIGDLEQTSVWGGQAAETLGLEGPVDAKVFETLLEGHLPNGEKIAHGANGHRPGMDLTFSAPKSVSLIALVGGDTRLVEAQTQAVQATMTWAEKRLAEARSGNSGHTVEKTGKLAYALFNHDTSRASDPQLHTHAIVANLTQRADGAWRALRNDKLWSKNKLLGAIYHNELRIRIQELGYRIENREKNGMFEIAGIDDDTIKSWSTRNEQIKELANKLNIHSAKGKGSIALRSREAKAPEDLASLKEHWQNLANERGHDFKSMIEEPAKEQVTRGLLGKVRQWGETVISRAMPFLRPKPEPLVRDTKALNRAAPLAAAYAVTAAVRHLGERHASFSRDKLLSESLGFAEQKAQIGHIEKRVDKLIKERRLIAGRGDLASLMTTPDMVRTEKAVLDGALSGRGAAKPAMRPDLVVHAVERAAQKSLEFEMSEEQLIAAKTIVAGPDKVSLIQGDAGAGKTTIFTVANAVPEHQRDKLFALVPQNSLIQDIEKASKIPTDSLASFLIKHEALARGSASVPESSKKYLGSTLIVDEASMLSSKQMLGLIKITEKLDINRLVLVGDTKQIPAIEAGKPFYQLQQKLQPDYLVDNRRQQDPVMRDAVALLGSGYVREAFDLLADKTVETPSPARDAAEKWLSLDTKDQASTAIFTAGHKQRLAVNAQIAEASVAEGRKSITLEVRQNLHLTRAQLRQTSNYAPGLQLDIYRYHSAIGVPRGSYEIIEHDKQKREVSLNIGGLTRKFRPDDLHPGGQGLGLSMKSQETFHEGDKLIWTGNDKARNIANGNSVTLKKIDGDKIQLTDQEGRTHLLKPNDPIRDKLGAGAVLNMHRAQGLTTEKAIAVLSSEDRMLNSQSLAYVLASRSKGDFALYLDDREKIIDQIERNSDKQISALDVAGEMRSAENEHMHVRKSNIETFHTSTALRSEHQFQFKDKSVAQKRNEGTKEVDNFPKAFPEKKIELGL